MGFTRQEYWVGSRFLLRGIFPTQVSCIAGRVFTIWATREAQKRAGMLSQGTAGNEPRVSRLSASKEEIWTVGKSWFKSHLWHLLLMWPGFSWLLSVIKWYLPHKVTVESKLIKHVSTVHRVTKSQTWLKRRSVHVCVLVKLQWGVLHDMYRDSLLPSQSSTFSSPWRCLLNTRLITYWI